MVSVLVRADFSVSGRSSKGDMGRRPRNLGCVTRYRGFESGSLQRRVRKLSVPPALHRVKWFWKLGRKTRRQRVWENGYRTIKMPPQIPGRF
jgi:hypothetical protein